MPNTPPRFVALIPCAGAGLRAAAPFSACAFRTDPLGAHPNVQIIPMLPKQYQPIAGKAMVLHTLDAFAQVSRLAGIVVAVAPEDAAFGALCQQLPFELKNKLTYQACGGATRAHTVRNGLQALYTLGYSPDDWVLVHDAARCLITPEQINALIDACQHDAVGGLLAAPVADTLKQAQTPMPQPEPAETASASSAVRVQATLERSDKWAAQTPQMFRIGALQAALDKALQLGMPVTDEASALEASGFLPKLIASSSHNFKVTFSDDFALAEALLRRKAQSMSSEPNPSWSACHTSGHDGANTAANALSNEAPNHAQAGSAAGMGFRIGEGWDVHRLVEARALTLGGVTIPHPKGLLGHSDADALCHAITDALLGALALGDIGKHFPDTDPRYQGASSIELLRQVAALVRSHGWQIRNIDSTVIAQAPKLAPFIDAMRQQLSAALGLAASQVSVKAKTYEGLGAVGQEQAIEARAVALLGVGKAN